MTIKLTPASFLSGVRQSGLIDPQQLDLLVAGMANEGVDSNSATAIAAALVKCGAITEWQSEKLLQGRHKGFVLGRYKLLSLLGAGEMSAVYLAEHVMLERRCAIKVLPGNKVKDTSYLGRFHREAKAVARLDHVNIVRAYDVDQQFDSGTEIHFLVMEYVAGKNIEKVVSEKGRLEFVTAAEYIRQAAEGLSHAHQAGMVHRDIKPENLLIDKDGIVKILDLGLARFFQATEEESLTIKHDEKVLGTADYLAPEQAIDSHKVDARADIYSLGCTFYFALTGHPPFTEGTLVQRLFAHQTKTPTPIRTERPDTPEGLIVILEKMMAKKAADRFQTAMELASALTHWLVDHGGHEWRVKHVVQVAQIKGMDGFNDRPAEPTRSANGHKIAMTNGPGKLAASSQDGGKARESAVPVVEFYSTPSASLSADNRPEKSEGRQLTPALAVTEPQRKTTLDSEHEPVRERKNQDARRKLKPRSPANEGDSEDGLTARTGTAVATRTRTAPAVARAKNQVQETTATESSSQTSNRTALYTLLNSNDASHVQTRHMIVWVTVSVVALTGFSIFLFWVFQGLLSNPEKQVTQPRQDAVIDASPRSSTV